VKSQIQIPGGIIAKLMVIAGFIWILSGLFFLLFVFNYVLAGAGLQLFAFLDAPGSLFIGWVHVMGFFIAAGVCVSIGIVLCARGLVHR
jgi:hypothetical protein